MREIRLKAFAKINLGLDVLGKRENGYHDLRMVMQTVGLHDRLVLTRTRAEGIRIAANLPFLPVNEDNLIYKACRLLRDEFHLEGGVFVDLEKHIPVAAGLAGGSTDAAAALLGMNRLFDLNLSKEDLMERAVSIGADVPYCVLGGTALAEGIGELLTPLENAPACSVLLAKPNIHVSTKHVYSSLPEQITEGHPDIDGQVEAIRSGDLAAMAAKMGNVLESVTIPEHPVIEHIKECMIENGALNAMMSGSGPTVFGLFDRQDSAQKARTLLQNREGMQMVFLTEFVFPGKYKKA